MTAQVESERSSVDIIVLVLNEASHLENLIADIDGMRRPWLELSVTFVEGGSTDGTRELLEKLSHRCPYIRVIDNPGANKSRGLNQAIEITSGQYIAWLGAHASYPSDYLVSLIKAMHDYHADAVGGILEQAPAARLIAKAIVTVNGSRFGAGNAAYRTGADAPREVDTVFPGFWRRETVVRLGGFNEGLLRAQDREFSARLRARGGRIMIIPWVRMTYHGRTSLLQHLRWMFVGGKWVFRAAGVAGPGLLGVRNIIPLAFFGTLIGGFVAGRWFPEAPAISLIVLGIYAAGALLESLRAAIHTQDARLIAILPPVYFATHAAYAAGSVRGLRWFVPSLFRRFKSGGEPA